MLFTLDSLANAGTEKSMLEILSHFSKNIESKVVYFFPGDLKAAYEKSGIPIHFADLRGKNFLFHGVKKLRQIIKDEKPDLVVSSIIQANLISRIACRITGTKLIGTFVSDSYSPARISNFSLKRKAGFYFFYRLDRLTAHIPAAWISNSEYIKTSNCRFLKVDPAIVKVIYRGRDTEKFDSKKRTASKGIFRFVYIGRLLETKGLKEMIEAFKLTFLVHPAISLDIYGAGPFREEMIKMIDKSALQKNIILHGVVANGWEKLYDADCFIFPSWYEGFSGSLVEAMMTAIPIIASDIPMNLEAVTDSKTALIHKVKNTDSIALQMKKVIAEYESMVEMGMRAKAEATRRFDIKTIAMEYEEYLRGIS